MIKTHESEVPLDVNSRLQSLVGSYVYNGDGLDKAAELLIENLPEQSALSAIFNRMYAAMALVEDEAVERIVLMNKLLKEAVKLQSSKLPRKSEVPIELDVACDKFWQGLAQTEIGYTGVIRGVGKQVAKCLHENPAQAEALIKSLEQRFAEGKFGAGYQQELWLSVIGEMLSPSPEPESPPASIRQKIATSVRRMIPKI